MKLGLCSITFRGLTVEEVITAATEAQLDGIEWGSDVHVLPGDLANAKRVKRLTKAAGLTVTSYGSYYHLGSVKANPHPFSELLATAVALGAPVIRVWTGTKGAADADQAHRDAVLADTERIATLAAEQGVEIRTEYHGETLTDAYASTVQFMEEVARPDVRTYWQPTLYKAHTERLASLKAVAPWLSHVHVFHWDGTARLPLADGADDWLAYIRFLNTVPGDRYLLLEFVVDDAPAQLRADAATLRALVDKVQKEEGPC